MCTVSFYKDHSKVIITSNRDESIYRPLAIAPKSEYVNGRKLFFPKDPQGGGTWFVINEYGNAFVLLNGAEFKHISTPPYRKSRGIILLDLASALSFDAAWNNIELLDIEPFTIVAYVNNTLIQLRWNGETKEYKIIENNKYKIWSSSTLYEPAFILQRVLWFEEFIFKKDTSLTPNDFIDFHTYTQNDDLENGIIINRNGQILTKNITQFVLENNYFNLLHIDLIQNTKTILNEHRNIL